MMDFIGDRYRIIRTLGEGVLGIAYLAFDEATLKQVVIKLLAEKYFRDQKSRDQLKKELQTVAGLKHPNIINIRDFNQIGSSCYMVTDFVEGKTLRQRIKDGDLNNTEAVSIATQVAKALKYIHKAGVVHSDLRPENILLDRNGKVMLTDLAVAKILEPESGELTPFVLTGNMNYMAPEQIKGQKTDRRTDLWSLGAVIYEMTMHQPPFKGKSSKAIAESILKDKPKVRGMRDTELREIVNKALQKSMDKRYQSAGAMVSDLEDLKTGNIEEKGVFGKLWDRIAGFGTSETRSAPSITTGGGEDDSTPELYINLWLEDEHKSTVDLCTVLSAGSTYTFLFAIENFSREDQGSSTEFSEPTELSEQPKTRVVIELLCPFLVTEDDSGYVLREVDYFAGLGFPSEEFTLKPKEAGYFYLTARLLIKGETIYREVLTLEVSSEEVRASEIGANAAATT